LPQSALNYTSLDGTLSQLSGSWIYKGEWNGTINNKTYVEARYGVFGYYFPLQANSDTQSHEVFDNFNTLLLGADQKEQTDRQRRQATGSVTYFKDGWGGSHNFKLGGELLLETGWYGYTQVASGNLRETIASSGAPSQVQMYAPTATHVGSLGDGPNGNLLSVDKVNTAAFFITDQWSVGRATLNLGVRYDHYDVFTPDQSQLAYTFPSGVSIPAMTFPEQHYVKWGSIVPRLGATYDLMGTGKTVLKVNYGMYRFNPGVAVAGNANPNQQVKSLTYQWLDNKVCPGCIPGDKIYQPGEEGALTASALAGNVTVDPNIKQPLSHQATFYVEQQLSEGVGARVGFVYYSVKDQTGTFQPLRPAEAYTVPFTVVDVGPDGIRGTADDQALTAYGIPSNLISSCATTTTVTPTCLYPTNQVVQNSGNNGSYKTFEASLNKRMSHNYSVGAGYGYTWRHDFPYGYPNTRNGPFDYDFSSAGFKANAQYNAPFGILLSAVYRYQLGENYARRVSVSTPSSCACAFSAAAGSLGSVGNGTNALLTATDIFATPYNAYRQDNISVVDLRVEKTVPLGPAKIRLFLDGFNLANAYAAETINTRAGVNFQQPTAILGPRTGRVGFRLIW
jgi:hypothetical protein